MAISVLPGRIGRFEITDRIGRGGMGTVYRARDPLLGHRFVAIKVFNADYDTPELRERFGREAAAAGRLSHPNIVTIYDIGEHGGQPFIAMEYIVGETLADLIVRQAPLTLADKLRILEQVCCGLAHAHRAGIVHRDVKPANIMVVGAAPPGAAAKDGRETPRQAVKIVDFGIARVDATAGLTKERAVMGTFNYMSPEQMTSGPIDQRSDIFAVGAVAYELISYQQAFPGGVPEIFYRITNPAPASLREACPFVSSRLDAILMRALAAAPSDRYQDLDAMRAELLAESQRVEARGDAGRTTTVRRVASEPSPKPKTPRRGTDRSTLERLRARQIEEYVGTARKWFEAGDYELAIESCEQALVLNGDEPRALDLLDRARAAIDNRQVQAWVEQAREQLREHALTSADRLVAMALSLDPESSAAAEVRGAIEELRRERERAQQRLDAARRLLERAHRCFADSDFEMAMRLCDRALENDPALDDARQLKTRAADAYRAQRHDGLAREAVSDAVRRFDAGEHREAMAALSAFSPAHEEVTAALARLRSRAEMIAARVAAEEQRRAAERDDRTVLADALEWRDQRETPRAAMSSADDLADHFEHTPADPTDEPPEAQSREGVVPPPARRLGRRVSVVTAVGALAVASALVIGGRAAPPPRPTPPPASPLSAVSPAPAAASVTIGSDPSGARILLGGVDTKLRTPAVLQVNGPLPQKLELEQPGFAPITTDLTDGDLRRGRRDFPLVPARATLVVSGAYPFEVYAADQRLSPAATKHVLAITPEVGAVTLRSREYFLEKTVPVDAGTENGTTLPIRAPALGTLFIDARPENCPISIDGRNVGPAPVTRTVAAHEHVVALQCPGQRPVRRTTAVRPGGEARVQLKLSQE